ncbi:hypothetical protein PsYK624_033300 [Phanerochaete sordida]|uniref:Uncharacterized protein n=1 Tax=Phanerochaete sordida TaxID=48140 RepID=A0A9P3G1F0_9APHY|nr:hypothetical protein PsYK624_033300 [Phanerochaete sordida]
MRRLRRASKALAATRKKWILLAACLLMYANAATHFGLTLASLFEDNRRSNSIQQMLYDCFPSVGYDDECPSLAVPDSYLYPSATTSSTQTTLTVLLSLNMVLGDAIVLWRAWVLWQDNRTVKGISLVLMTGTSSTLQAGFEDFPASFAVFFSWCTNIWSTTLIAVRAWQHRRQIGAQLHSGGRTRAQTALLLLIESGVLYTLFWTPLAVYAALDIATSLDGTYYDTPSDMRDRFMGAMAAVQAGVLIDIVGMYPTAVILLVEASSQYAQRTLSLGDIPTLLPQSDHRARLRAIPISETRAVPGG